MSDGYNKPQYHACRSKSAHEPAIGEEVEWNGHQLVCVEGYGCHGCFFNEDFRKTKEHRVEVADVCMTYFCEADSRADRKNVKLVRKEQG